MTHKLDVRVAAGSVEIIAEPRDTPAATVEPYDDDSNTDHTAAANTRVELRGDTLFVHAPKSHRLLGRGPRLRVQIRTPLDSEATVEVASANTVCRGRLSDIVFKSASGDLRLEHSTGTLSAKTASGDVDAGQIDGKLNVGTASGDVSVQRVGGPIKIGTVSGAVEIERADGATRVDTVSGGVRIDVVYGPEVTVMGVSGDVTVGVPAGTGVWLNLNLLTGSIRSDLDVREQTAQDKADLNVRVGTVSGDIEVRRVAQPATRTAS